MSLFLLILLVIVLLLFGLGKGQKTWSPPKQYGRISKTDEGVTVRSYSEKILADYFTQNNIAYKYEATVFSKRGRKISNPDFYLPQHYVYVEYGGLVDAPEQRVKDKYVNTMKMGSILSQFIRVISITLTGFSEQSFKKLPGIDYLTKLL
jgi:hypothetical protein